ncbi:hypothetical protein CSN29_26135 [Salmonella enterica subsp. diarizonae]|nr:hypothetical protein [Salmonella enterica]ECC3884253.1 hypothetical protein [Salmonella enterica subsp. diarizonae]ECJ4781276.1 hypothetical protein [Salmonella enterica subsp. diarizonae]EDQ7409136.1 hypothetical protein [Salmonella enterica subsp. diarizonae]
MHGLGLFAAIILDVVTNSVFSYGARRLWRWEVLLVFPDRRGRESAARAGLFRLSTGQAVNRLCF